jgi:GNAT superfamily N-acetyltransferase
MQPDIEPGVAQLAYLFVSRSHRRRGVAVTLLEELTEWAREHGARELYVSSAHSASAVGFYQAAGFSITDHPNQELLVLEPDDIHMRKRLSD